MGTERKWLHKVFSYEYANNKIWHITDQPLQIYIKCVPTLFKTWVVSTVLWLLWLCHWTAKEFNCMWERSSEEMVTFEATMYVNIYGRQLLEKCWNVWDSHTTFQDQCAVAVKKQEQSLEIYHGRLSRVCSFILWWGSTIQCTVTGLGGSVHHVELTVCVLCTKCTCYFHTF